MKNEVDNWGHRLYQIDWVDTYRWTKMTHGNTYYVPQFVGIKCPTTGCNNTLGNLRISWNLLHELLMWAHANCSACNELIRYYLINPPKNDTNEGRRQSLLYVYPAPPLFDDQVPEKVQILSPAFIQIYTQAVMAEKLKLNELTGMGYRKALEFLIKDYLVSKFPDKEHEIKAKYLVPCIKEYIEDTRIKGMAERAAWLGNDETHYFRKWQDKDLEDLKSLLRLTLHWLHMEFLTQEYELGMTRS